MNFKDYMQQATGWRRVQSEWAKRLDVSRGYVNQLYHGKAHPSLGIAMKIFELSDQKVSPDVWLSAPSPVQTTLSAEQD